MSDLVIRPTTMELVQSASDSVRDAKAKIYTLRDKDTGKHYKSLDVIVFAIGIHRVFWGKARIGEEPECSTMNGITPLPNSPKKQSDFCATCPQAVWVNGNRSACREKRIPYFVDAKLGTPYEMVLPGSSVRHVTRFSNKVTTAILLAAKFRKKALNMWDFKTTLVPFRVDDHAELDFQKIVERKDAGTDLELFKMLKDTYVPQTKLPAPKAA